MVVQSLLNASQCWPFPGSLPGSGDFRVIFRLVWEAEKVGWEVNYEFFSAQIHLVWSEWEESGKHIAEFSGFSSNFGV